MEEIQDLSKQIYFDNSTYHCKGKNDPRNFTVFKGPLSFYRSIKKGDITPEKAEEHQKKLKSNINEIIVGSKTENQKITIKTY